MLGAFSWQSKGGDSTPPLLIFKYHKNENLSHKTPRLPTQQPNYVNYSARWGPVGKIRFVAYGLRVAIRLRNWSPMRLVWSHCIYWFESSLVSTTEGKDCLKAHYINVRYLESWVTHLTVGRRLCRDLFFASIRQGGLIQAMTTCLWHKL